MYKIYYNEKAICLMHIGQFDLIPDNVTSVIKLHYTGKTKFLLSCMDKVEKNKELQKIYIFYHEIRKLKDDFLSLFKIVPAAGGLVINEKSELLMIFRRGKWDLPKGKMEEGETKKQSALREVIEETGLKKVQLINKLCTTYHIYLDKHKRRVLKPSYWYLMYSSDKILIPQIEEDIEKVEWVKPTKSALKKCKPMHSNIADIIDVYNSTIEIFF